MAGIPSHTKNSPPKKGSGSTREKAKSHSGQRKSGGSSSSREEPLETSASRSEAVSVDSSSRLLFLTTTKEPSSFKDPDIQKMISKHVMQDYKSKQQSGQEPSSRAKGKQVSKYQGDEETVISTKTPSSHIPIRGSSGYISNESSMLPPSTLSSALTQSMSYPLNIDLNSLDFQHRVGNLLSNYMRVWFEEQATRLCGGGSHNAWKQWMPDELNNETLLYAQAFAAVTHINFLNPQQYPSERWNMKGQAIQAISKTLRNQETPHVDGNIGAVLCMAVVAPLDWDPYNNFITHINGLHNMVRIRGGLHALRSNKLLHDALCLCDLSGAIIFRTNPVLVAFQDLERHGIADNIFDSPLGRCDNPAEPQRRLNLPADSIGISNALYGLTRRWTEANRERASLKDSDEVANRCVLIERQLSLGSTQSTTTAQNQTSHYQVREACRLAGLIYFRALFHNIPFSSSHNAVIMQGLKAALENSILSGWNGAPGLLLWVLLVGTAAARSNRDENFFAGHLSTTCFCLVTHWHDVQQILAMFWRMERMVERLAES